MPTLTPVRTELLALQPNIDVIDQLSAISEEELALFTVTSLLHTIRRAEAISFQGISHRDFQVGAIAVATNDFSSVLARLSGFNVKPDASGRVNIHAEQMAIEKAKKYGLNRILAFAVWGEPQPDTQSGRDSPTLHPCGLCRDYMGKSGLIAPETIILSGGSDFRTAELYTYHELCEFHDGGNIRELCGVESGAVADTCSLGESRTKATWEANPQPFTIANEALVDNAYFDQLELVFLEKWASSNPRLPHARLLKGWFDAGQPKTS